MGGFAVIVDWERPVGARDIEPMLSRIGYRAKDGFTTLRFDHAVLTGTDTATRGTLGLAGDLRLIRRDRLRSAAGGRAATANLDDAGLVLAAYERQGSKVVDAIDGDYAFVIWDDDTHTALAVRDRFGITPIFFERTDTGVRFASEVGQIAATAPVRKSPNPVTVAGFLLGDFTDTSSTFFEGIERVPPAESILFSTSGETRHRYWNPAPNLDRTLTRASVPDLFREHLVDSVRERLTMSPKVVPQLSGGLDSTAIVASAHIASAEPEAFATVSMVFPGYATDESRWIDDVTATLPIENHRYTPAFGTIDDFKADMAVVGGPRIDPIHGATRGSAEFASNFGAGLLLTGTGGDYVLDASRVPTDVLTSGHPGVWFDQIRRRAADTGESVSAVAVRDGRAALPTRLRKAYRALRPLQNPRTDHLAKPLRSRTQEERTDMASPGGSTRTARGMLAGVSLPVLTLTLELIEAAVAPYGVAFTDPFLDRTVVEFMMSIPPLAYPYDGSYKPVVRRAFASQLPPSITTRGTKTVFNDVVAAAISGRSAGFAASFPTVSEAARPFIDATWYTQAMRAFATVPDETAVVDLWPAWSLMLWLDTLS